MRFASVRTLMGAAGLGGAFVAGGLARDHLAPPQVPGRRPLVAAETASLVEATKERLRGSVALSAAEDPTKVLSAVVAKKISTDLYLSTEGKGMLGTGTVRYLVSLFTVYIPVRTVPVLSVLWILIRIRMFFGLPDLDCHYLYGSGSFFMSFCRILSTLCSHVVFHIVPHFSRGRQKSGTTSTA
jgi:hypothetical protein